MSSLVSIIIPFKNTSCFLTDCISSIIQQTYTTWEAIFVDDGSTDISLELVKKASIKDNRIRVVANKGTGIIEALRTAYHLSNGTFITRMDSDDIMKPHRLQWMVAQLKSHGSGHLAIGQVKYFRSDGVSDGYKRYEQWINSLTAKGANFTEIYKECVVPSPCWMVHREDLEACGAFRPNRYPEDYDLTFRFYKNNLICIPCDEILLAWRDYSNRTSRTHEHYAQNYFLDIKTKYFIELDYDHLRPLTIWGAGFKGKTVAKLLIKANIPFLWICNNPKKIGKRIYKQTLLDFSHLEKLANPQSIVTVANEEAKDQIRSYFKTQHMAPMIDYFFFC